MCSHIFQNRGFNLWKEISKRRWSMDLHSTFSHLVHKYPIRFLSEPQYPKFIINHLSKLQGQQSTTLFWTLIKKKKKKRCLDLWENILSLSSNIRVLLSGVNKEPYNISVANSKKNLFTSKQRQKGHTIFNVNSKCIAVNGKLFYKK